jgi:sensor c-di-GMP phosphodiesterase-like protein
MRFGNPSQIRTRSSSGKPRCDRAIGTDELSLVYQPIVELGSEKMVSAEALLRWKNPTPGTIPPGEFIPIAEEMGRRRRHETSVNRP